MDFQFVTGRDWRAGDLFHDTGGVFVIMGRDHLGRWVLFPEALFTLAFDWAIW